MVTTTIKEAKASIMNLAANAAAKPKDKNDGDSFQKVFDKQTGNDGSKAKKTETNQSSIHGKKTLENAGKLREKELKKTSADAEAVDPESLEDLKEISEAKAMELMAQISEILGVSGERMETVLQDLEMTPADLLDQTNLNEFVMELSGVKDAAAWLTDGELYGKLQEVLNAGSQFAKEAGEALGLDAKEFLEQLQKAGEKQGSNPVFGEVTEGIPEQMAQDTGAAEMDRKTDSESESNTSDGQSGNLVLQEMLRADAEQAIEPVTEESVQAQRVDTEMIMRQILDHMKIQLKPDISSLEMQLHPASLGNLQVHLTSKDGALTAQFFAQNETVKAALETQMIQLQESFEEQGIKVDAIEVSVQTRQFDQNLEEQGRGRQEQTAPKSRTTRRIRIEGSLTQEQLDGLTQDERISAEMMQAGGGTVDFMA